MSLILFAILWITIGISSAVWVLTESRKAFYIGYIISIVAALAIALMVGIENRNTPQETGNVLPIIITIITVVAFINATFWIIVYKRWRTQCQQ